VCISQPKYGGTVITGVYADMNSLDPHKTGSHQDMRRVCLMCNNLVETTREGSIAPLSPRPGRLGRWEGVDLSLAKGGQVSQWKRDDGRRYQMEL